MFKYQSVCCHKHDMKKCRVKINFIFICFTSVSEQWTCVLLGVCLLHLVKSLHYWLFNLQSNKGRNTQRKEIAPSDRFKARLIRPRQIMLFKKQLTFIGRVIMLSREGCIYRKPLEIIMDLSCKGTPFSCS